MSDDKDENYSFDLNGRGQEIKLFKGYNDETNLEISFKSNTSMISMFVLKTCVYMYLTH